MVPVAPGILTDSETVICERNVQDIVFWWFAGRLRDPLPLISCLKFRLSLLGGECHAGVQRHREVRWTNGEFAGAKVKCRAQRAGDAVLAAAVARRAAASLSAASWPCRGTTEHPRKPARNGGGGRGQCSLT